MIKLKPNKMKKLFALIICFVIAGSTNAQNFKWQAKVDSVPAKGFYNILMPPSVNGHLDNSFNDIRLFDEKNAEVPYLLRWEAPIQYTQLFKEYKIISKQIIKGCCTNITLENPEKTKINNIRLIVKNADVQKKMKLSGSDDQQNWYVVKDKIFFQGVNNNSETFEIKLVDFPLSNYAYYKIEIDDSASAPVNITQAGYYDNYTENGKYVEVSAAKIIQGDSIKQKKTYVKITFDSPQYIDKLELEIEGPVYYLRKGTISEFKKDSIKKRESRSYYSAIQDMELSSNNPKVIYFSNYKAREFYLLIENEDNPPLKIKSAKAYQLNHYLTAYLEKEKHYILKFGDDKVIAPAYDLNYFQDSIPKNVPVLLTGSVMGLTEEQQAAVPSSWFSNKAVLWIAIGIVVILLAVLSLKMIKEMNDK
jgi:hypothetical protein